MNNLVKNHRDRNKTEEPLYLEALAALSRRESGDLNPRKSFEAIRSAARDQRFISYKELAEASGADWAKARRLMGKHLGHIVERASRKGWPLLSAIVVNIPDLQTGNSRPSSLRGFIAVARSLGIEVTDELAFLKDQQRLVFEWGSRVGDEALDRTEGG